MPRAEHRPLRRGSWCLEGDTVRQDLPCGGYVTGTNCSWQVVNYCQDNAKRYWKQKKRGSPVCVRMCACTLRGTCACMHMCVCAYTRIFCIHTCAQTPRKGENKKRHVHQACVCQSSGPVVGIPDFLLPGSVVSFALSQNLSLLGSFISNEITQTFIPERSESSQPSFGCCS